MHLKEFTYQRPKCKHGPVPIKTRPRTEGVGCSNHPVCFASLAQYCSIQQAGNGFVSPHCVCSVYQKQITVFFLSLSVFSSLFIFFFLKACMHVIAQSTFIDQTNASVCPPAAGFPLPPRHDVSPTFYKVLYKSTWIDCSIAFICTCKFEPFLYKREANWFGCMGVSACVKTSCGERQSAGLLSGKTACHLSSESLMCGIQRSGSIAICARVRYMHGRFSYSNDPA